MSEEIELPQYVQEHRLLKGHIMTRRMVYRRNQNLDLQLENFWICSDRWQNVEYAVCKNNHEVCLTKMTKFLLGVPHSVCFGCPCFFHHVKCPNYKPRVEHLKE